MELFIVVLAALFLLACAVAWQRELAHLASSTWLYLVIAGDFCLLRAKRSDFSDTGVYRERRAEKACELFEEFRTSSDLLHYVSRHQSRISALPLLLWQFGEDTYFFDLMRKSVMHKRRNITVTSSPEQALDRFRMECPDYDPYTCFALRLAPAKQVVQDFRRGM